METARDVVVTIKGRILRQSKAAVQFFIVRDGEELPEASAIPEIDKIWFPLSQVRHCGCFR